jgi:hypothetical protein
MFQKIAATNFEHCALRPCVQLDPEHPNGCLEAEVWGIIGIGALATNT